MTIVGIQWAWVDLIMIGIVLLSALISLLRGFVKEALSLATWIVAAAIGKLLSPQLSELLVPYISLPSARVAAAFVLLFVGTLIVGALVNQLVTQLVKATGLSGTDRLLGMVFGLARGVLVVSVIIGVLSMTPVVQDPWWKESRFIPAVLGMWEWTKQFIGQFSGLFFNAQK